MYTKKYTADYHMHSNYSEDSETPVEDMIKRAIEIGLDEIALTDHVDHGVKTIENCNYEKYFKELKELHHKYKEQIKIKIGIEFGAQPHTISIFEEDFKNHTFDFVLLSNHQVDNKEFWNYEFQEGKTQKEFHEAYYKAIYEVVKNYKNYSVLGHLDVIRRYDKCGTFPDELVLEYAEPILKQIISDGKGIELNTSSFKYGLTELMPSRNLLKRYYELGGTILTLGSDAHEPTHIADHFDEVRAELKKIGFTKFCTFDKMKPIFHDL